jgi:hypothetical protein
MNFINRMLIVLELLFLVVLGPVLIVVLLLFRPNMAATLSQLVNALTSGPNSALTQLICMGLAALMSLIAILFLILEFQRPAVKHLKVQQVMGGDAEITADAIVHRLEQAILQIPDILKVRSRIASAKKGNIVDLAIEVETNPDVNVPQKTQEVLTTARSVTEEKMGLKAGKIQVRLDHSKKVKKQKTDVGQQQQPPQLPQKQVDPFEPTDSTDSTQNSG